MSEPLQNNDDAPELKAIYANFVSVSSNPLDFTLLFGRTLNSKGYVQGAVILSPETAKELCRILSEQIDAYESNIGKINTIPRIKTEPH